MFHIGMSILNAALLVINTNAYTLTGQTYNAVGIALGLIATPLIITDLILEYKKNA